MYCIVLCRYCIISIYLQFEKNEHRVLDQRQYNVPTVYDMYIAQSIVLIAVILEGSVYVYMYTFYFYYLFYLFCISLFFWLLLLLFTLFSYNLLIPLLLLLLLLLILQFHYIFIFHFIVLPRHTRSSQLYLRVCSTRSYRTKSDLHTY